MNYWTTTALKKRKDAGSLAQSNAIDQKEMNPLKDVSNPFRQE